MQVAQGQDFLTEKTGVKCEKPGPHMKTDLVLKHQCTEIFSTNGWYLADWT